MKGQPAAAEQPARQFEWKTVLATGIGLGAVAGIFSLFGKTWFNYAVPGGMMIACMLAVNRSKVRLFWSGFTASFFAGLIAWAIYLAVNYSNIVAGGASFKDAVLYSAAFLLPLIAIIGIAGSWIFSRTRGRVLAAKERLRAEQEAQKQARKRMYRNRPRKKYKKKKK